jgi:hypothetical protein
MAVDAIPGAADADPTELLDVEMDKLSGALSLIAVRWLWR